MTPTIRASLIASATQVALQRLDSAALASLDALESQYRRYVNDLQLEIARAGDNDGYFLARYLSPFLRKAKEHLNILQAGRLQLLNDSLHTGALLGVEPLMTVGMSVAGVVNQAVDALWQFELATDNLHLSDRIWRIDNAMQAGISQALRQAIAAGANPLQAAKELLRSGKGLPPKLLEKLQGLSVGSLQSTIESLVMSGRGNALYNMQRLFMTETIRAHAISYVSGSMGADGLKGFRFKLSPRHKRADICDRLSSEDRYGLGTGIFPADQILKVYPAHPNTTSFIVAVFD